MNSYEEYRSSEIIKNAELEMKKCKHPYVGTEHLLLALLKCSDIKIICEKYNLTYSTFKKSLMKIVGASNMDTNFILHTPLLKMVVMDAIEDNDGEIDNKCLLLSILENGDGIAVRILMGMNIKIDKLYCELKKSVSFVTKQIDFGINLNETVAMNETVFARDKEINLIIETLLRKNKSNPILVGPAGVGKTAIVEELARRINLGKVPKQLKNKKIISLEMFDLVAGTKYRGEFEEKIKNVLDCVKNSNDIILFIDEVHTIVHAGGSEGAIDAANILKPYLSKGNISIIGATTIFEYNKFIKKDKALERRFQLINIVEPKVNETIEILNNSKKIYENHYGMKISKNNIKDIVLNADKFIKYKKNPDKSFEVLDLLCSKLCLKEQLEITKEDIKRVFEEISNINIDERFNYNELIYQFSNNLVGQGSVIKKIINSLKMKSDKPLSMLFCGSSGVGKTKATSILSEVLGYNLIKLDMAEYGSEASINKLIGAPNGYHGCDDEFILESVRFNPRSIIVLDEVEKGSKKIINLFLNVLDEGILKDNKGDIIDFSRTIIILTSNLKMDSSVGFFEKSCPNKFFSDEFIARLDEVIYFNDVDELMINEYLLKNKSRLNTKDVMENCDYKKLGFRAINRYIKNNKKLVG